MLKSLLKTRLSVSDLNGKSVFVVRRSKKQYLKQEEQILRQHSNRVLGVFEVSKQQQYIVLMFPFYDLGEP